MKHIIVKQLTLCLTLTLSFLFSEAQVVSCYFPNDYVVDAGSTFTAEVRVDSFINVGGCGFSLQWDPAILKYKEVGNFGVTIGDLSGFNELKVESDGLLGFSWVNPSATEGKTLADSSILFTVSFDVIGNGGDTTSLRFVDDPVAREFATLMPSLIPSTFRDATVTLSGTSSTNFNSAPEKITIHPPVPNPFSENTFMRINLQEPTRTTIQIIDLNGKVLYKSQDFFGSGEQSIPISKDIFESSGTYFCLLHSNNFRVTQKLVFVDR